jgi:hypothetical protein
MFGISLLESGAHLSVSWTCSKLSRQIKSMESTIKNQSKRLLKFLLLDISPAAFLCQELTCNSSFGFYLWFHYLLKWSVFHQFWPSGFTLSSIQYSQKCIQHLSIHNINTWCSLVFVAGWSQLDQDQMDSWNLCMIASVI